MKKLINLFLFTLILTGSIVAHAEYNEWNWNITPYAWLIGLKGDVGAKGLVAPVDQSFSDSVKKLTIAGMVSLDGNNGTWGMVSDIVYLNLDDSKDTALGKIKGGVDQWIVTVAPYARIDLEENITLDLGAGGHYLYTSIDVNTPAASRSQSKEWVDPVILARVKVDTTEKLSFILTGDIGGFGVNSDLTWQLAATAGYQVSERVDLLAGYRYLDIDYKDGGFLYDTASRGLMFGVRIKL